MIITVAVRVTVRGQCEPIVKPIFKPISVKTVTVIPAAWVTVSRVMAVSRVVAVIVTV